MALNESWNIKTRATTCSATDQPFEDGDTVHAAIFKNEGENEYQRLDFCTEAWEARKEDPEAPVPYSKWRTSFEVAVDPNKKPEVVEKESAETLLRRLIEEDEEKSENARYILAVMLERKKQLVQVDTMPNDDESRMLIYEHAKTGEAFIVRDPLLKLAEIDAIQEEVAGWLGGGKKEEQYVRRPHTIWIEALSDV
jgi:hypothetical protein